MSLQCDYSNQGHLTKFPTNLSTKYCGDKHYFQQIIQNDHNSIPL